MHPVHRAPCTVHPNLVSPGKGKSRDVNPTGGGGCRLGHPNFFMGRCAATSLQKGMLVEEVANRSRSQKFGSGALGAQHPENTHSGGAVERRLGCPKFSFGALSAQ